MLSHPSSHHEARAIRDIWKVPSEVGGRLVRTFVIVGFGQGETAKLNSSELEVDSYRGGWRGIRDGSRVDVIKGILGASNLR